VMEEAIPIPTPWECPKQKKLSKTSQQKKDEFSKELSKTKVVLREMEKEKSFKVPPIDRPVTAPKRSKILSMKSLPDPTPSEKPISDSSRNNALGAMRDWRGVSESSPDSGNTPRRTSMDSSSSGDKRGRNLSTMLRSTGGEYRSVF
jgi:hypothetical protein